MKKCHSTLLLVFLMAAICLSACGGGGSSDGIAAVSPNGELSVGLTDATTDEFQAVYITVKEISVSQTIGDDCEWVVVAEPNGTYNLLELVNGIIQELGVTDIEAGQYNQMRLLLGNTPDDTLNIKQEAHPYANYVVYGNDENFQYFELDIPSGYESGFKIVGGFEVQSDELTDLVLDFNVVKSIIQAGSSGKWLLQPTVKAIDQDGSAIISGTVSFEDLPIEGAIVSAQSDPEESGPKIVSAATVSDASGGYALLLEPGAYTVVAIKEGYQSASAEVTVAENATAVQNFPMVPVEAESGTIYGAVKILNGLDDQYVTINILETGTEGDVVEIASKSVANGGTYWFDLPAGLYSMVALFTLDGEEMTLEAYDAFKVSDGSVEEFDILFSNEGEDNALGRKPEKVTICHKGKTITISASALQAHLNHGDTEGSCEGMEDGTDETPAAEEEGETVDGDSEGTEAGGPPAKVTVCHKGKSISVSANALDAHLAHGDTEGACEIQ